MSTRVLVDTSALYALANPDDTHHTRAQAIHQSLIRRKLTLVLPNFLLAETHTIINRRLGSHAAREFLTLALQDFEIERVTLEDEWAAHALLQDVRQGKDVSYFDAVAVAVAERLGMDEVFTFDRHFARMGMSLSRP